MAERAMGKVPPGLYMRDIAEVRKGAESYDFKKNPDPPSDPDRCLSLIGTERTISLELPSKARIPCLLLFHRRMCNISLVLRIKSNSLQEIGFWRD